MQTNKQVELEILNFGSEGQGIGRLEGLAVFVPGALPGERVLAEICHQRKNYAQGKLLSVLTPAPGRQLPRCRYYEQCGGCQLQHFVYEDQLAMKRQMVRDALQRIAGVGEIAVDPVLGMAEPWRYRNRGRVHLSWEQGQLKAGFFAQESHELIPVEDCLLFPEVFGLLAQRVAQDLSHVILEDLHKDKTARRKNIESMVLRQNKAGQIMLILEGEFPSDSLKEIAMAWQQEFSVLETVMQNYGPKSHAQGWGSKWQILLGSDVLADEICDARFLFSPTSFAQVNALQTQVLYEQIRQLSALSPDDIVWDIYCGVGTIGIVLAKEGARLWGVEENASAIRMAKENARLNGIFANFEVGRAELVLPRAYKKQVRLPRVVVVDPPRSGCKPEVLQVIADSKAPKIIYVSCHPATLARDVKLLSGMGYTISAVRPVDMFPQTSHVESIVLMTNSGLKGK